MPFSKDNPEAASLAGQRGGLKTKERMLAKDPDHFRKIGRRGGQVMKNRDPKHFTKIGHMKKGEGYKTGKGAQS